MSELFPVPDALRDAEYSLVTFVLESRNYFDLSPLDWLRLRREFKQALRELSLDGDDVLAQSLKDLLEPPLPDNPHLRRRVQRPSPAVVLRPDLSRSGLIAPGDRFELSVLFLGRGMTALIPFARLIQQVAQTGLFNGQAVCELVGLEAEDGAGRRTELWSGGELGDNLSPVVNDLYWWLQRQPFCGESLVLEFITPLRLIGQGRPLFKARFGEVFPFILRRVTSMVLAHCPLSDLGYPAQLTELATRIDERENSLHWQDWRPLNRGRGGQDLGGLRGRLVVSGSDLAELLWVLQLGTLFHIGKGAAYGSGACFLHATET
ncbi:MAG: hypothetical protein C0618_01350 [Desulfuromonas sp.]|nr:MAG: hypothetical protein C0618_01350 [Desulfuromonas sp.]